MRLSEYKGKQLLKSYGIPIPIGFEAKNLIDVKSAVIELDGKAVIKAMVPVGGRGKAGLVKIALDVEDAIEKAKSILGKVHGGHTVEELIIESAIDIRDEYYISVILDDVSHSPMLIFSINGGVDIEEVAAKTPERIIKAPVSWSDGNILMPITEMAIMQGIPVSVAKKIERISCILAKLFVENDLLLAEINPLVLDDNNQIIAADCKLELDDSAIFKHPEYRDDADKDLGDMEKRVKKLGSTLVNLGEGDVGIICNGAGMGMAMIDMLNKVNLKPINFLDSGGGLTSEKAKNVCDIMFEMKNLKALIINLWGSITLLDNVADGIIESFEANKPNYPVIARFLGNGMAEGMDKLEEKGIIVARVINTEDAINLVAQILSKGAK